MTYKQHIRSGLINLAIGFAAFLATEMICTALMPDTAMRALIWAFVVTTFAVSVPRRIGRSDDSTEMLTQQPHNMADIVVWASEPFAEFKIKRYLLRKTFILILMLLPFMAAEVYQAVQAFGKIPPPDRHYQNAPDNDMDFAGHPGQMEKIISETRAKADSARYFALQLRLNEARILYDQGKYRETIAYCKTITNAAGDTSVSLLCGRAFLKLKQADSAIRYFKDAEQHGSKEAAVLRRQFPEQ